MDLKRRLGFGAGANQNYELIRSTQSLVDRLNLNSEEISIQPVHPSIMGQVEKITILIYKDKGRVRRQRKPVGRIKISVSSVLSRREVEKWYPVEKASRPLVRMLESHISVKVKEEFALALMNIFKIQDVAEDILADIVVHEISNNDNETLTFRQNIGPFRGNSIATKAMEAYIKMVGEKYLEGTLAPTLHDILASNSDLEVDPIKVGNPEVLHAHRQDLRNKVAIVWKRIANSHSIFPVPLQRCFHKIRQYLEQLGKSEMAIKLISSCLFLRYLCPAILGPNLFNITDEYPGERANRNLTLIAKTLQTLANFARYEGKENSMEFMNGFLDDEAANMRQFLNLISSPPPDDWIHGLNTGSEKAELGKNLSHLHTILVENICKIPAPNNIAQQQQHHNNLQHQLSTANTVDLDRLKSILNSINSSLHRPTTVTLDNIAEPTPVKIKRMSVEEKSTSPTISQNNVISNWMSWTLGRGEKKTKVSEPIPQHKLNRSGLMKTTFYTPDVTESSSSSASLTPSPKYAVNPSPWSHSQTVNIRKNMRSVSSISIIDDSDSESSSASSQYRVDSGGHPALHYTTLPRSKVDTRTLADYEREIHGLRSAMETLQVKLSDAERKLQEQQANGSTSASSDRSSSSTSSGTAGSHEPHDRGDSPQDRSSSTLTGGGEDRRRSAGSANDRRSSAGSTNDRRSSAGSGGQQTVISISGHNKVDYSQYNRDEELKDGGHLRRLVKDEEHLRREHDLINNMEDKELMILLQQRKIAALDEANTRLVTELNKIGEKTGYKFNNKKKMYEHETPKTVDELLDSFNDTPV